VSLKDSIGALSLTVPAKGIGFGIGIGSSWGETEEPKFLPSGTGPELMHGSEAKETATAMTHFKFL
jgi:hypothetical protein